MNRDQFVALITEEGFTISEAEAIWDGRKEYNIVDAELSVEGVRTLARELLPTVKRVRAYYGVA